MLKGVLFDLDNTLIRFNERDFFEAYIPQISAVFSDIMSAETLIEKLLVSTHMLTNTNGQMSNAEYFMSFFARGYEGRREELWNRFIKFYETGFDQFKSLVSVLPGVREVFVKLKKKGVKLVIASNPIWPQVQTTCMTLMPSSLKKFLLLTWFANTYWSIVSIYAT